MLVEPLDATAVPFIAVTVVVSQQKEPKLANYYCRVRRRYRRHCCETRLPNAEGATGYELTSLGYELTSENPEQHNMC